MKSISARNFARNMTAAMRAAARGPVFITDRGRPAFALLNIEDYYRIAGKGEASLLATMDAMPGGERIEFEPPRLKLRTRAADLA